MNTHTDTDIDADLDAEDDPGRRPPRVLAVISCWMLASAAAGLAPAALSCGTTTRVPADLVVTSHAPVGHTDFSDVVIQLSFDQPVIGEDQVGVAIDDPLVRLTPAAEVSGHWYDRQTLLVEPKAPLRASTRYRVALAGDLGARTGGFSFEFVHRPLAVEGVSGVDLAMVPREPVLTLQFNQPVRARDVTAGCMLRTALGTLPIPLAPRDPEEIAPAVAVTPALPLEPGRDYELACDRLTGAGGDTALAEPYALALRTHPLLSVTRISPRGDDVAPDDLSVEIEFSTPVELETVRAHLTSRPPVPALALGWLDGSGTVYRAVVSLETTTEYEIGIGFGLTDTFGQTLSEPATATFVTGDARPRLSLETGIYALETAAAGYPVWTRNVRRYDVRCAAVPKSAVVKLLTSAMDYDPWYDAGDATIDWKALGLRVRTESITIDSPKNKWHLDELSLHELCGGGAAGRGLYLADLSSAEIEPDPDYLWRHRPNKRVLANVTDLGVLLKAGPASGLVWVTSISTGEPVAGASVTLYSPKGQQVHRGTTDESGILRIPGTARLLPAEDDGDDEWGGWWSYRSQRLIGVVERGGDLAIIDGNWQNGIQTWNFGVPEDRAGGETRVRGFIQSDRGIYRPGETVHFKGIAREIAVGRAPAVPRDRRASVRVEDSRGSTLFERRLDLSRFGGFAFDLPLEAEAPLGDYRVIASVAGQSFRERFVVEEFRAASFEVGIDPGKRHDRLGGQLRFDVKADYLFGAPVAGAEVTYSVQRRPHSLRFARFPSYGFADHSARGAYDWWHGDYEDRYLSFVSDGEGKTDARGRFGFTVIDPKVDFDGPQDYVVTARVRDATDQVIARQAVVTGHRSDFYLGLHSQEYVQAVGMPFSVNTVAVSPTGDQVATRARLSLIRQTWQCSYSGGYRAYQECQSKHDVVLERDVDIPAGGVGTERIYPEKPGEYVVRLSARDARGNEVAASSHVWVVGKGEAFWSGDESARMALIASRERYRPGDTARLVARTDLRDVTALVTLERNGVMDAFVRRLDSGAEGIEIELGEAHAPNVYASVAMVTGRSGEGDRHRPRFKMGVVDLPVSSEERRLRVVVETERPGYEPGQQVSALIRVTAGGHPVSAEVSLSVADEGVLQLIAYQTPDPMKTFYASWGLGVDNGTNWNRIARLNDPTAGDPDEGGDAPGGDGPQVRSRFVSSAFWAPSLVTDERGEVRVTFTAPDNLTAFRLMAVAADEGSRFGAGEHRITIAKPLLAKPVLPRFFTAGDRAEVGVVVHNHTGRAGTATVAASARGARLAQSTRTVALEPGGEGRVRFSATAGDAAAASFEFRVTMGEHADALALEIPINKALVLEHRTLAQGVLGAAGDETTELALAWDDGLARRDSHVTVTVDRTGLTALEPSLRYLIEYPYGCLEQTLSRFIPLTKVKDLAGSLHLASLEGPKLDSFIRAGVARVIRHQRYDGHFSLWQGGPTYPHLTVYAVYGLSEARRAGVTVEQRPLELGVQAIRSWAGGAERTLGPDGETATMAMAAYVLAELGQADAALSARLFEVRRGMPRYGQAFLLRAMHRAGAPAAQVATLRDELTAAVAEERGTAVVREQIDLRQYMSSDVRTSAVTLSALLEVDPGNPLIEKLAEGLVAAQRPGGAWYNTQDNLYALVALSEYARRETAGSALVTLSLGGERQVRRRLQGPAVLVFRRSLHHIEPGQLTIEAEGKLRYQVRVVEARTDAGDRAIDRGFAVTREYLDPTTGRPIERLAAGQLVNVRVTVATERERLFVAVVDPLPAGFEALNPRLATSGASGPSGAQRWDWTWRELRDDEARAFADRMRPGTHTFEYQARATLPGTFVAQGARAEAMYEPDVNGRSLAAKLVIAP